jgi:ELWxxDGT repeat protein
MTDTPITINNSRYFKKTNSDENRIEIWKEDITSGDIVDFDNFGYSTVFDKALSAAQVKDNIYYVSANDGILKKIDPVIDYRIDVKTSTGNTIAGASNLTALNDALYFFKNEQFWKFDLKTGQEALVSSEYFSVAQNATNVNGILYFTSYNYQTSKALLWELDNQTGLPVIVTTFISIEELTNINGTLYLRAVDDLQVGASLWQRKPNDQTVTEVFRDNLPPLENYNDRIYFQSYTMGTDGNTVSRFDPATQSLIEIATVPDKSTQFIQIESVGNTLYARTSSYGGQDGALWKLDPITKTATKIELEPGNGVSHPGYLTKADGAIYFAADTKSTGRELWKIDPSNSNPVLLQDLNPGSDGSEPNILGYENGKLYISVSRPYVPTSRDVLELATSSTPVFNYAPEADKISDRIAGEGQKFSLILPYDQFSNANYLDPLTYSAKTAEGSQLPTWLTFDPATQTFSGTPTATDTGNLNLQVIATDTGGLSATSKFVVSVIPSPTRSVVIPNVSAQYDINNVKLGIDSAPAELTNVGGIIYLTADNGINGRELWKIDPKSGNPILIDVKAGSASSNPKNLTNVNGILYFTTSNEELWKLEPNATRPVVAKAFPGEAMNLITANGILYFSLYEYDEYGGGMQTLFKIESGGNPTKLASFDQYTYDFKAININNTIYFVAADAANGSEIWKIGANGNVTRVTDIEPGAGSSNPSNLTEFNNTLYFNASSKKDGLKTYKIDPTSGNPILAEAFAPNFALDTQKVNINGVLYFVDPNFPRNLWKVDPKTNNGLPAQVTDYDTTGIQLVSNLKNVNGTLYYTADYDASSSGSGITGKRLWKIDSTTGKGVLVDFLTPANRPSDPKILGYENGKVYLSANNGVDGNELWEINPNNTVITKTTTKTDFNGDSKSDILWRNNDGSVALWQMNGSTSTPGSIGKLTADWTIAGTGDFNGDKNADILLSNTDSRVTIWQMNGSTVTAAKTIGTLTTGWSIAGIGDFNGDESSDLLFQNTNGTVATWQVNNSAVTKTTTIGTLGAGWSIAGIGDFNRPLA